MRGRRTVALLGALLMLALALGAGIGILFGGARGGVGAGPQAPVARRGSPAADGWPFDREVPSVSLTTAAGGSLSLSELAGKVIVLAPSLTLCHEVCPMTTQAFISMQRTLAHDRLASAVAFVEATVDPWRDSPARLRAYDRLTGAHFIQLTGGVAPIRRFWGWFGIGFRRAAPGGPPAVDWWTHRPETFDVEHTDGVFLIDQRGYERTFYPGIADVEGRVEPRLRALLSRTGLSNLAHPGAQAWTQSQVLAGIGRLLGRRISHGGAGG